MSQDDNRRPKPRSRRPRPAAAVEATPLMRALQASVMRSRRLFEAAFDAMVVVDRVGHVIDLNPAAEALFGRIVDAVVGHRAERALVAPTDGPRLRQIIDAALLGEPGAPQCVSASHPDGSVRAIELKAVRADDGDQVQCVLIARPAAVAEPSIDLERRRAESTFVASLSHDIRTPLSAITTLSQLAVDAADPDAMRRHVTRIEANAQVLRRLVGDLLDVAMLDVEHLAVEPQVVDLLELLTTIAAGHRARLEGRAVALRTAFDTHLPPLVVTDPRRLQQVLDNLLNNAGKMTDAGHIELGAHCLDEGAGRARLRIRVADTGPGIPPEMRRRLFERFGRSTAGIWTERAGSGLGLSICKALVELLGGQLTFETEVGRGTIFFVDLDVELAEPPGDSVTAAVPVLQLHAPEHGWILVVDDSEDNRVALGESLRNRGWTVALARDGRDAVTRAMAGRPDVILMDVEMTGMDGLEATRRIRQIEARRREPARPIFALTGHATAEMRARCLEAGMNGFYTKPFDLDRLHADLWQLLNTEEAPTGDAPAELDATLPVPDVGGLDDSIRQHLPAYFANRRQDVGRLRALADAADFPGIGEITHRLRGTCGLYGMPTLVALAHHIDQLVDAREIAGIRSAIEAFDAELDRLEQSVSARG